MRAKQELATNLLPVADDVSLLKDAEDMDYLFWRKVIRLGVVTQINIGANAEVAVQIDGQTTSIQVPKNQHVSFAVDDRVLLIDTNGNGGYVCLASWLI